MVWYILCQWQNTPNCQRCSFFMQLLLFVTFVCTRKERKLKAQIQEIEAYLSEHWYLWCSFLCSVECQRFLLRKHVNVDSSENCFCFLTPSSVFQTFFLGCLFGLNMTHLHCRLTTSLTHSDCNRSSNGSTARNWRYIESLCGIRNVCPVTTGGMTPPGACQRVKLILQFFYWFNINTMQAI